MRYDGRDRILILTEDYPSREKPYAMAYVHSRSVSYLGAGVTPVVGSFRCKESYDIDGVKVVYPSRRIASQFDIIFCHAPNLKNHFRLLRSLCRKTIVLFIHGHEVLHNSDYPTPYEWRKSWKDLLASTYDHVKLVTFPYIIKLLAKNNTIKFVFVSSWMKEQFERRINIDLHDFECAIIANSVHPIFRKRTYARSEKSEDVITIRPLDQSKYAIDLVLECARANPKINFDVYGKGVFFNHNASPKNLRWFDRFVPQSSLPELLNQYKLALMPTRYDAQGVSVCEMATFGMPVVTSNIPICREMFSSFNNVTLVDNRHFGLIDISPHFFYPGPEIKDNGLFDGENLSSKELRFGLSGRPTF
ncbi:glycosyltransferase [Sphingobium sp. YBL2]|uniref:glycosyltransferase n=1 Tax=Sphingobium sp. (strain YBL2) TaxID=484429 RepID=UPI000A75307F|nr:glycosyltransferase [Sphingobium sp. YBL2]